MAGTCECRDEHCGFIKCGEFLAVFLVQMKCNMEQ